MMKPRRMWVIACVIVVAVVALMIRMSRGRTTLPTAEARYSEFVDYQQLRGEVQATKSFVLSAPFAAGDLQILTLAKTGTVVKTGEVVVQFDTTTVKRTLDQKQGEVKSADAEIARSRAQSRLDFEQKTTDVLDARYNVERAKLDVSKQEILSDIEAQKTRLTLADTEQKLQETETKLSSSRVGGDANLESVKQKRNKAGFDLRLAERQMVALTLRAPVDGVITISPNFRARGFSGGSSAPEFKSGDRAWPGASIAEIPELASMRVLTKVDEIDRGRLEVKQEALVRVDAIPDKEFAATVATISAVGKPDFSLWPPPKNFDVVLDLKDRDPRLRPGMSANVRIVLSRSAHVLTIPAESVFERNGKSVVYVVRGSAVEERSVSLGKRGEGRAVVERGLSPGERVSLKNPVAERSEQP
jgi:HlyD family secretion protein